MSRAADDGPGAELTTRIGRVAHRALTAEGIVTYADLARRTEAELAALHGVGPKALAVLREELASRGLSLPPTGP